MTSVSVVMITLNEEGAIAKVVGDVRAAVPEAEVLVVDSSSDRTAEIARSLGCRVIEQKPPRGYGPAMDTALKSAAGDVIVTIDCDDTYPADVIPYLVQRVEEGYDIAAASRLKTKPAAMPLPNYIANVTFNFLGQLICGVRSTDLHTGVRAYRAELIQSFPYEPNGMALPVELLVGPARMGYKYCEIFIDYRPRIGETTLQKWQGTVWTLRRLLKWHRFATIPKDKTADQQP